MRGKFLILCWIALGTLAQAQRPDVVIYPRPREDTKLAVVNFVPRTVATQEVQSVADSFNQVAWRDLEFSAFFEMPSRSFYPLKPLRFPIDVNFDNWQVPTLDVDFLVFGNLQVDRSLAMVEAYLYDVKTHQQVLGKRYTISDSSMIQRVAHEFADQVVFQLSAGASQGVARAQIAFTSLKSGSKEVYIMDYDGGNQRTITANGGLNKFPEWSFDNKRLAFVTTLPGIPRWELWIQNVTGGRVVMAAPSSYVSSPAFSPDGETIAFSGRRPERQDAGIYVANIDGTALRNLSNNPAIDTSPTWSPTGQQIAFISDRSGSPQLWVMDSDGTNVQRLVTEGGHCDSPDWSPDGRFIVYSWQAPTQWRHDIYVIEVATGKIVQLTSGRGDNESPHWSPDGRHVTYQSTRTGTKQIFVMNADGKNLTQITAYGVNESPSWAGYAVVEELEEEVLEVEGEAGTQETQGTEGTQDLEETLQEMKETE